MTRENETQRDSDTERQIRATAARGSFQSSKESQCNRRACHQSQSASNIDCIEFNCNNLCEYCPSRTSDPTLFQSSDSNSTYNVSRLVFNGNGEKYQETFTPSLTLSPFLCSNLHKKQSHTAPVSLDTDLSKRESNGRFFPICDFEIVDTSKEPLAPKTEYRPVIETTFPASAAALDSCNQMPRNFTVASQASRDGRKRRIGACAIDFEKLLSKRASSNYVENKRFEIPQTHISRPIQSKPGNRDSSDRRSQSQVQRNNCTGTDSYVFRKKRRQVFALKRRRKLTRSSATRRTQRRRNKHHVIHSRARRNSVFLAKNQPYQPRVTRTKSRIPDNFYTALITTLFCCFPLGIASLVYTYKVRAYLAVSNRQKAQECSLRGRKLANTGFMLGITAIVYTIVYFMVKSNIPYTSVEYDYYLPEYAIG